MLKVWNSNLQDINVTEWWRACGFGVESVRTAGKRFCDWGFHKCTRACECHDVASEKRLARRYDRQDMAWSWIESQSQKHERIRFAEILAGLCSGQVRSQRGHTSWFAGTTEVRVLLRCDNDGQGWRIWNEKEDWSRSAACMWGSTPRPYSVMVKDPRSSTSGGSSPPSWKVLLGSARMLWGTASG